MRFQIIGSDGKRKMRTDDLSCVYDVETLKNMEREGFRFKVDGRFVKASRVHDEMGTIREYKEPIHVCDESKDGSKTGCANDSVSCDVESDSTSFTAEWRLCKRSKSFDDLDVKSKSFSSYSAAEEFIDTKYAKTSFNYWAGGSIVDNQGTVLKEYKLGT